MRVVYNLCLFADGVCVSISGKVQMGGRLSQWSESFPYGDHFCMNLLAKPYCMDMAPMFICLLVLVPV